MKSFHTTPVAMDKSKRTMTSTPRVDKRGEAEEKQLSPLWIKKPEETKDLANIQSSVVEITVDSGAAESVMPKDMAGDYPLE